MRESRILSCLVGQLFRREEWGYGAVGSALTRVRRRFVAAVCMIGACGSASADCGLGAAVALATRRTTISDKPRNERGRPIGPPIVRIGAREIGGGIRRSITGGHSDRAVNRDSAVASMSARRYPDWHDRRGVESAERSNLGPSGSRLKFGRRRDGAEAPNSAVRALRVESEEVGASKVSDDRRPGIGRGREAQRCDHLHSSSATATENWRSEYPISVHHRGNLRDAAQVSISAGVRAAAALNRAPSPSFRSRP